MQHYIGIEKQEGSILRPEVHCLKNGLRVIVDVMPHVESASVGLMVDSGSRHETLPEHGMSHLLEHMLFKGTARRDARLIAEQIEDVGGHMNAYTSRDHTTFYAKVLKDDVPLAVDLLADISQHSVIDETELAREREVVLQEIGQAEDTPDDIVFDYLQNVAYPDQPLGRSILGTQDRVASFQRDEVLGFLKSHYLTENSILVASGNVDPDKFFALVEEQFQSLPTGKPVQYEPASYGGGELRKERPTEQLHLTFGLPSVSFDDADYYATQVYSTMLGGGMSSRLFQEVREIRGLAYSIYSFGTSHLDTGLFGIYAGTSPELAEELAYVICDETLKMTGRAADEEILRARAQLKAGLLMSLESTSARIEQIGRQLLVFGRIIGVDEMVDQVNAVDMNAITRVGERLLSEGALSLASVGPSGTLPDYEHLSARLMAA